jgi:hypothetical protein
LVYDSGALADQAIADAMDGLQIQLVVGFGHDKAHGWPRHSFCDCRSVIEVVLLPFDIRLYESRRDQTNLVSVALKGARKMLRSRAGFHSNEARSKHFSIPVS